MDQESKASLKPDKKYKILVAGDVKGNFNFLINKIRTTNSKLGPFDMLFCCGDFFDDKNDDLTPYKHGTKKVPIPIYILGPNKTEHLEYYENLVNDEICPNITYLGKRGLYTFSSGIKVAYLSGLEKTSPEMNDELSFGPDDVIALRNSCLMSRGSSSDYRGIDILLTSQWPSGINNTIKNKSNLISSLVREIRPRYHFAALNGVSFEPPPFRTPADQITQLELSTRFVSVGYVSKTSTEKFLHGLDILPVDRMRVINLIQKTTNETACPFDKSGIFTSQMKQDSSSNSQYFFDLGSNKDEKTVDNENSGRKRKQGHDDNAQKYQRKTIDTEICWFCLSSPNVEKHLIISIGKNFYLALAKGPINETHILILSIKHIQKASLLSKSEWKELNGYKESLRKFFAKRSEVVCFFERNYRTSHLQINVIAIDADLEWKIKHAFSDKSEEYSIALETLPKITDPSQLPQQGPYFVAELPDNTVLLTKQMKGFPLHFARDVFCSENLLNCDEKVDWRECTLSKSEENELAVNLKESYMPFDPTLK